MNYLKQFLKEHKGSVALNVLLVLAQTVGTLPFHCWWRRSWTRGFWPEIWPPSTAWAP